MTMAGQKFYNPTKATKPTRKEDNPPTPNRGALLIFAVDVGSTTAFVAQGSFGSTKVEGGSNVGSGAGKEVQEGGGTTGAKYGKLSFLQKATETGFTLALIVAFKKYGAKNTEVFFMSCSKMSFPGVPGATVFREAENVSVKAVKLDCPSHDQSLESKFQSTGIKPIAFAMARTLSSMSPIGGRKSNKRKWSSVALDFKSNTNTHIWA